MRLDLEGNMTPFLPTAMYSSISFSPNGEYLMVGRMERPFSYIVPYYRFPSVTTIYDNTGKQVSVVNETPLEEVRPKGRMSTSQGRRSISWRADKPQSLVYVEALDAGDPAKEVDFRDEVFQLEAPFKGDGKSILKTINRYAGIMWGDDDTAIAYDRWWDTRNTKTYVFNPSKPGKVVTVTDRNYQDRYADPGSFVMERNEYGRNVLAMDGDNVFLIGDGFSDKGQFPFLDQMNLKTKKTERLYESTYTDKYESLNEFDVKNKTLMVRVESPSEFPNYAFRDIKSGKMTKITDFPNPFAAMADIHKEVISYKRADGLDLSGTLYLPPNYDMKKRGKLPKNIRSHGQIIRRERPLLRTPPEGPRSALRISG